MFKTTQEAHMTKIIGHRGAKAYFAENTLPSFEAAILQGADGIELDIHYSKDGEIMVFHDFTLKRMCGIKGAISDYTLEELKAFTVSFKKQREKIPTLREVLVLLVSLEQMHGRQLILNVEFKAGSDLYPGIEAATLNLCSSYLKKEQVIYSSFDHFSLQRIRALDADAQTGVLTGSAMVEPWEYVKKLKANYYHPAYQTVNAYAIEGLTHASIGLNPYTVNDLKVAKLLIHHHANAIITDTPDKMVALRTAYENNI